MINRRELHLTLERVKLYKIEYILKLLKEWDEELPLPKRKYKRVFTELDGYRVKTFSDRYEMFLKKGIKCCICGKEINYVALEKSPSSKNYYFNFYYISPEGEEILFTKDHIKPKSKGGSNSLKNYQPMCHVCNEIKGNK